MHLCVGEGGCRGVCIDICSPFILPTRSALSELSTFSWKILTAIAFSILTLPISAKLKIFVHHQSFLLIIFCVQFHYIDQNCFQTGSQDVSKPDPSTAQWWFAMKKSVTDDSELPFFWSYTLYNIQGWQWGNISTAQEQHSDQILAKYENIGKLKKVEWLTPVVEKNIS